jgi:hypothetical protein
VHTDIASLHFLGLTATSAVDRRSYLLFRLLAKRPERLIGSGMDPRRSPTNFPGLRRVFPSDAGGPYLEKRLSRTDFPAKNVGGSAAAAGQMCRLRSLAVAMRLSRGFCGALVVTTWTPRQAIGASARRWPLGDNVRDPQCRRRHRTGATSGNRAPGQLRFRNIELHERVSIMAILACIGASVPARHSSC